MQFIYYLKNSKRDPDNVSASRKYIMDGLVQAGIIANDNLEIIQSPIIESFVVNTPKIKILTDEVVVKISDEFIYH
jgi:Holliday junction resolvase RusA-like endonuclease